jgi:hypothetical protein
MRGSRFLLVLVPVFVAVLLVTSVTYAFSLQRAQPLKVANVQAAVAQQAVSYTVKWSQPPTITSESAPCFYGWDEASVYGEDPWGYPIVADDWLCEDERPISDIHWWGSYKDWMGEKAPPTAPVTFHIGIWTDVPAVVEPPSFSHPGELIHEWFVERAAVSETVAGCDFHPAFSPMETCFSYTYQISPSQWFYQLGGANVYWLSIAAIYTEVRSTIPYTWGWKTRPHYFNDDAVRIFNPVTPGVDIPVMFVGEPIEDLEGQTWDMAFELTTPLQDFGDAPDPNYPTLLASKGARHIISSTLYLGKHIDGEPDGQPTAAAGGDDVNPPTGLDDEDGVSFTSALVPGQNATVNVIASAPGLLNAWVDFNIDGDWLDAGEQIFTDVPLVAGANALVFPVPPNATLGLSYARFRFSTQAGLAPTGPASDGEVEDYTVDISSMEWDKWIEDQPWWEGISITVETSDTITVADVVTSAVPFVLVESWDPSQLAFLTHMLTPTWAGNVLIGLDSLTWNVPFVPTQAMTLTKLFHVEPCTWTQTILTETLYPESGPGLSIIRPVIINKLQPVLHITASAPAQVRAGQPATFTLFYSNTGGREDRISITNTFPLSAPFARSDPWPDAQDPSGLWAWWNLGTLTGGVASRIMVTVDVTAALPTSSTVVIWDGIYDHVGQLMDQVTITMHVLNVFSSTVSGDWNKPATWGGTGVPTTTSDVTITAGTRVTVSAPAACNKLYIEPGAELIILDPFTLTVEGTFTNDGHLTMARTNASPTAFSIENAGGSQVKYYGMVITPTGTVAMGLVTVTIKGNQSCGVAGAVLRCYEITPTTQTTATIQLYYRSVESNTNSSPLAWHWDGSRWDGLPSTYGGNGDAMWVQATNVTEYSPFLLKDGIPTTVALQMLAVLRAHQAVVLLVLGVLAVAALGLICLVWARNTKPGT